MRIDPAIEALRRDRAPQRRAQAAMAAACDAWRAESLTAAVMRELEGYGAGTALRDCPSLAALFDNPDEALELVDSMVAQFSSAMSQAPMGHPALRHGLSEGHSTLLLGRSGCALLTLHGNEPAILSSESVRFSDAERFEIILAGRAEGAIFRRRRPSGEIEATPIELMPGTAVSLDLRHEALHLHEIRQQMVILRLERSREDASPSCEYSLDDGRLIHQSSASMRASRQEMMLALLGRMECREAAPLMAEMACEEGQDSLRWQALRECLALDTATGFGALSTIATSEADQLSVPAGALRARLIETYPQLLSLEDQPCRA